MRYRPSLLGLVLWGYAAYFATVAVRWALAGDYADAAGSLLWIGAMCLAGAWVDCRPIQRDEG